jgi:glycine cleavage system transcriptional repressor
MAERDQIILTAIGPDQVGLVEKISQFISRNDCNIEDSKMAVFCGEFAIILLISGEASGLARIRKDYRVIEAECSLSATIKSPTARRTGPLFLPYTLTATCMDHPGIVYQISGMLSNLGVNIESMETKTYSAPVSGTPLFQLEAQISIPVHANINQLRDSLEELQREENIDIDLTPVKS